METKANDVWVSAKLKTHYNKEINRRYEENQASNNEKCRDYADLAA